MVQDPDLVAAESALGVELPQHYRDLLKASDGIAESMPNAYIDLWPLPDVVDVRLSDAYGMNERLPGLLLIGSDGGGELLGLDLRSSPGQVVLVNAISASWAEASAQDNSVSRLIARLRAGDSFSFHPAG